MSEIAIGNCSKHPGFNFVNCPMCEIERQEAFGKQKYFAVEYAGYWHIQNTPFYGGKNYLDAESVGEELAEKMANKIADLLNKNDDAGSKNKPQTNNTDGSKD